MLPIDTPWAKALKVIKAVAILALLAAIAWSYRYTYTAGVAHESDRWKAQAEKEKAERVSADATELQLANARADEARERADALSADLLIAEQKITRQANQRKERINDVTTVYVPAPGAKPEPLPACIFTRGWLRHYNAAIGAAPADLSEAGTTAGTSAAAPATGGAAAGEDDLRPAMINQAGILEHQIDYGARNRKIEAQLRQLVKFWTEGGDVQQ